MEASNSCSLSLLLNEESGEVRAQFNPAPGKLAPDPGMVRQALAEKGWSDFHVDENALIEFAAACRKAGKPLDMAIGARRDGEFSLTLDDDLLTAWLTLVPAQGGKAATPGEIEAALQAQGVVHGILRTEIDAAFAIGSCEKAVVAYGEPAREGTPTRFETLYDQEEEPAEEDDLQRIRYADLSHLLLVEPGDKLMRRIPPIPGTNGTDIKGHPILPRPTPDVPFATDLQGAAQAEYDPNVLVATSGGQPIRRGNGVMVNPVIDVSNVDLGTGSIEFEGTLRVGGDVKAGMRIKVTGDVVVNGTIEAAEIVAGGNVAVRGGIVGHPDPRPGSQSLPDTTARIFCDGTVQALFMENAHVEAGQSILVGRSARQCELIAREEIVVGKPGSRSGQLIGGRTQATMRVTTGILGTSTGIKTHVRVGFDPYLAKQIADKEAERKRKYDEVDRVIKLLAYFKQNPQKGQGGVAEKVDATRRQLLANIETLSAELKTLQEKMELTEQSRVEVAGTIHYGTEITIAQQVWQARDDIEGGGTFQLQGARIVITR